MQLSHHDLDVWKAAVDLVQGVYELTARFPTEEKYGLTNQMRRAAVSIPSNIAEGAARVSRREFAHYLVVARGSLAELETQVRISVSLGLLSAAESRPINEAIERTFSLLSGLLRAISGGRVSGVSEEPADGAEVTYQFLSANQEEEGSTTE